MLQGEAISEISVYCNAFAPIVYVRCDSLQSNKKKSSVRKIFTRDSKLTNDPKKIISLVADGGFVQPTD